jgi:hypothetical protein
MGAAGTSEKPEQNRPQPRTSAPFCGPFNWMVSRIFHPFLFTFVIFSFPFAIKYCQWIRFQRQRQNDGL